MRKALFAAGMSVAMFVTPSSAYTVAPDLEIEDKADTNRDKHEDLMSSLETLKTKTNQLIIASDQQIELYEEAYREAFKDEFRLTKKHVTFVSRLVLKEEKLLHSTREKSSSLQNAFSLNLLISSSVTAYELDQFLADTAMKGLGKSFVEAELSTGVNAIFLTALAIHESGWGSSKIARNKNNLFGYGAYDRSPYNSALSFSSVTEGTIFVANKLKENYLLSAGKYYSGVTLSGVNRRYSTDSRWASKIAVTMNKIDSSILTNQDTDYEVSE